MRPATWLLTTFLGIVIVSAAVIAFNVYIDAYGIFSNPAGRKIAVYGDERISKYLLSDRYVPANFDGVLIGSSVSANWNLTPMQSGRFYNESLNGGNIVEESALADRLIGKPSIRTALLIVHPFLTNSHSFETVALTEREKTAALGSQSLWAAYQEMLKVRYRHATLLSDPAGTMRFAQPRRDLNPVLTRMMAPGRDFDIDPIAWKAYRDLVAKLRSSSTAVVFIVPPTYEGLLAPKREAFGKYLDAARQHFIRPTDKVIDLGGPGFEAFRDARSKFTDGVHLTDQGAAEVVAFIDRQLRR